jgi:hypothetical protein
MWRYDNPDHAKAFINIGKMEACIPYSRNYITDSAVKTISLATALLFFTLALFEWENAFVLLTISLSSFIWVPLLANLTHYCITKIAKVDNLQITSESITGKVLLKKTEVFWSKVNDIDYAVTPFPKIVTIPSTVIGSLITRNIILTLNCGEKIHFLAPQMNAVEEKQFISLLQKIAASKNLNYTQSISTF